MPDAARGLRGGRRAVAQRRGARGARRARGRRGGAPLRSGPAAAAARRAPPRRRSCRRSRCSASSTCRRRSRCCAVSATRRPSAAAPPDEAPDSPDEPDLSDVRGHNGLIPALEVAAAGGHNLFLHGPPGTGKTMLARRLPSLLPPMTAHEAIEVTRLHSIAGLHGGGLVAPPPVPGAAPHDLGLGAGRRRRPADAGRGDARPPRRAVPRRAVGVRAAGARGAAPAARGRPRDDRARAARDGVPDARDARRRLEPVPVRAGGGGLPLLGSRPRAPPAPPERAAAGPHRRLGHGRPPVGGGAARPGRARVGRRARRGSSPRASARPRGSRGTGLTCNAQLDARGCCASSSAATAGGPPRALRAPRPQPPLRARPRPHPARRAHARRPGGQRRRCGPTTSTRPPRSGSTTRRSRWRHDVRRRRLRRLPAADRPRRRAGAPRLDVEWRRRSAPRRRAVAARRRRCSALDRSGPGGAARTRASRRERARASGSPAARPDRRLPLPTGATPSGCASSPTRPRCCTSPGDPAALGGGATRRDRRRPPRHAYGLEVARALGRGLAAAGVPVVSGMALGVDSAAHVGALEHAARRAPAGGRPSAAAADVGGAGAGRRAAPAAPTSPYPRLAPPAVRADRRARLRRLGAAARLHRLPLVLRRPQPPHRRPRRADGRRRGGGAVGLADDRRLRRAARPARSAPCPVRSPRASPAGTQRAARGRRRRRPRRARRARPAARPGRAARRSRPAARSRSSPACAACWTRSSAATAAWPSSPRTPAPRARCCRTSPSSSCAAWSGASSAAATSARWRARP